MKFTSKLVGCALGTLVTLTAASPSSALAASYSSAVLADQPIAYWRFNDGIKVPVLDAAVNKGSLGTAADGYYSGATHAVKGALAKGGNLAASVTGGQNVQIPYNADLSPSGAFTAEAWLRPATSFTDATLTCALAAGHFASPRAGWLVYQASGGFNFRMYNQNGTATSLNITGGGTLVAGAWYHLVVSFDGTDGVVYVNGLEVARGTATGFVPNPDSAFTLGMRSDNSFGWSGDVDEVAFYGVALTPAQVTAHFNNGTDAGAAVSYDALVLGDTPLGYWRLDEPVFIPPVASNAGSLAAAAAGQYQGGAINTEVAPRGPGFIGFEDDNTALELDGVNDYMGTLVSLMNDRPQFTISGWVRRGADQAARSGLWGQNDIVEFGYIDNSTIQAYTDGNLDIKPGFANEEWVHLAVVSDGPTISIYTNGAFAATRNHTIPANTTFKFNVGGGGVFDGGGNFFKGQIDEVALFSKALTAAQICNQFAAAVPTAPVVLVQPEPVTLYAGDTISVGVGVCGSPALKYQWVRGSTDIPGATSPTLTIPSAKESDSGTYSVKISNDYGVVESDPFEITVLAPTIPILTQSPVSITRYAGAKALFSVAVSGTPPFTYQWQYKQANIKDATNATLVLDPVKSADAGNYRVVIKNPIGDLTTGEAALTVLTPTPGSYESAIVASRPVAFWRLGESGGTTAFDYVGGFDGDYGTTALGLPGALVANTDLSADFNGTDSAVTTPATMNGLTAFTVSGWIRRSGDQKDRTGLFGQNDLLEFGFIDNSTLEVYIDAVGAIDFTSPLTGDGWAFLAVTGDKDGVVLYYNGVAVGSAAGPVSSYGTSAFKFNIGGAGIFDATGNNYLGGIDEVALYDRALAPDEICAFYLAGSGSLANISIDLGGAIIQDNKPQGTAHDGQTLGAAWVADDGARKGVMEFDALQGDQIVLPADPDFNLSTGTISFWVRSAGVVGGGNDGAILFDRRGSSGDVIVQNNDGTIFVQATSAAGVVVNSFKTTAGISDDIWHHVAYVFDQASGGATTIYIDGAVAGSGSASAAWSWGPTQRIELGRSHDGYWKLFNGRLDDFRIYGRILNETEISLMAAGEATAPIAASDLKLRFSFDKIPGGLTLRWTCGNLQSADALTGATTVWADVAGAVPPYAIQGEATQKYYRIRR